jgi:hypothetical protein
MFQYLLSAKLTCSLLRPSSEPLAEANPSTNPSTTPTEDNSPANPFATSTEDSSPANLPIKFRVEAFRNVHFLDARNNEVAGFWQNGSVIWEEIREWLHIVITNDSSSYTPFPCLEDGDPEDPTGEHGPPIHMADNRSTVDAGYYVLLAYDGECESSKHHIHLIDTLISSYRFQRRDQHYS